MISRFYEFVQLNSYLKHFDLYQQFLAMNQRHRQELASLNLHYASWSDPELADSPELLRYHAVLAKLQENTRVLNTQFQNFDFTESRLRDASNDYELLSYEFLMDMFQGFIRDKSFENRRDFVRYVYIAERVIKKYFMRKFYVFENLDKVFVKILDTLLDSYYPQHVRAQQSFDIEYEKDANI